MMDIVGYLDSLRTGFNSNTRGRLQGDGLGPKLGFFDAQNKLHHMLYSNVALVDHWDPDKLESCVKPGGIFNFGYSPDGSLMGVACERHSFMLFNPHNRQLIKVYPKAHQDCVNGIRFLDSRLFATCSDDQVVTLWDVRQMKSSIATMHGHTGWVKNIEYMPANSQLLTSCFSGSIFAWDINRCQEPDSYRQVYHTYGLMRMRLSHDARQLIISTTIGYLLVVHDLNIDFIKEDLRRFKPNMHRFLMADDDLLLTDYACLHEKKRNRVEFVTDFPAEDNANMISSLQVHPDGWCVLSRNMDTADMSEWTCLHDIRDDRKHFTGVQNAPLLPRGPYIMAGDHTYHSTAATQNRSSADAGSSVDNANRAASSSALSREVQGSTAGAQSSTAGVPKRRRVDCGGSNSMLEDVWLSNSGNGTPLLISISVRPQIAGELTSGRLCYDPASMVALTSSQGTINLLRRTEEGTSGEGASSTGENEARDARVPGNDPGGDASTRNIELNAEAANSSSSGSSHVTPEASSSRSESAAPNPGYSQNPDDSLFGHLMEPTDSDVDGEEEEEEQGRQNGSALVERARQNCDTSDNGGDSGSDQDRDGVERSNEVTGTASNSSSTCSTPNSSTFSASTPLRVHTLTTPSAHRKKRRRRRLLYYIEEATVGRGFIKEPCFSSDGRIVVSPYGWGVRMLAADRHTRRIEPSQFDRCASFVGRDSPLDDGTVEITPRPFFDMTTYINSHKSPVTATQFSPVHCAFVSGCLDGKICFYQPYF